MSVLSPSAVTAALKVGAGVLLAAVLVACGGGDKGGPTPGGAPLSCSVTDQQQWLADYMNEWYFWTGLSPHPDPAAYADVDSYLQALLYTGTDPRFPADRYSYSQPTESFARLFSDGESLGWGVSVAGLELARQPGQPLYVRQVEALSPAGGRVFRGDQVISINGRSAADIVAADDYSALTTDKIDQTLTLLLRHSGVDRTEVLRSAVFALTPVAGSAVFRTGGGRQTGYLQVKDMITQSLAPLDDAFAQFKAAGVVDLVLDLRYNGGGLVSTGTTLASYIAGDRGRGLAYASLLYNDQRAATNNQRFPFESPTAALSLPRVVVLTGRRTCSASEQVINGLRGAGVEVVAIGEATCGKPVGFLPTSNCDRTYSIVNFESVNARNEGRYFDGLAPTCAVSEDFRVAQGGNADPLLQAARGFIDSDSCPAAAGVQGLRRPTAAKGRQPPRFVGEEQTGLVLR